MTGSNNDASLKKFSRYLLAGTIELDHEKVGLGGKRFKIHVF